MWSEKEELIKEIEKYLVDSGWTETGISIWVNSKYEYVECIDTNSYNAIIYTTENVNVNNMDIFKVSQFEYWIKSLQGLKDFLQT